MASLLDARLAEGFAVLLAHTNGLIGVDVHPIRGDLPDAGPISWARRAGNILYTAQVPIRADGSFELGDIRKQSRLTLSNLERTVVAAGGTTADVVQVLCYLTDVADAGGFDEEWLKTFSIPWPNRAVLGVQALTVPGMRVEIVATAALGQQS